MAKTRAEVETETPDFPGYSSPHNNFGSGLRTFDSDLFLSTDARLFESSREVPQALFRSLGLWSLINDVDHAGKKGYMKLRNYHHRKMGR